MSDTNIEGEGCRQCDKLEGQLEAAEQHVKILRGQLQEQGYRLEAGRLREVGWASVQRDYEQELARLESRLGHALAALKIVADGIPGPRLFAVETLQALSSGTAPAGEAGGSAEAAHPCTCPGWCFANSGHHSNCKCESSVHGPIYAGIVERQSPFVCTHHKFREDVGIPGVKRCHVCDYTVWPPHGETP